MELDILVKRPDRTYVPGQKVTGYVLVKSPKASSHNGMRLIVDGSVTISYSQSKNVSLWEAMINSMKPIRIIDYNVQLAAPGKIPDGSTEIPFEFLLSPTSSIPLFETYNGVYLSIKYVISAEMSRGIFSRDLKKSAEFVVNCPGQGYKEAKAAPIIATSSATSLGFKDKDVTKSGTSAQKSSNDLTSDATSSAESPTSPKRPTSPKDSSDDVPPKKPLQITMTPRKLKNIRKEMVDIIPPYCIEANIDSVNCDILQPFTGEITIHNTSVPLKSVELQLVRVESCSVSNSNEWIREATEIQNLQVAEGNVCSGLSVPIHMVLPRFFTCPTIVTSTFRIEFEMNLIILFTDGHQITENFSIYLYRKTK